MQKTSYKGAPPKELLNKLQAKSLKNHQNDIAAVMKTKRHFAMVASEIKTML